MANRWIDPEEIRRAINLLKPNNEIYECRIINRYGKILSGYFRGSDKLIEALARQNLEGCNVYFTLQKLHEGVEARLQWERLMDPGKLPTTADNNVIAYKYLPVDVDPVRPAGISSSAEELKAAERVRQAVLDYMTENGYTSRIEAFSGNGYHILFRLPEEVQKSGDAAWHTKNALSWLNDMCSTKAAHVDLTNYNPARIFKLYGTLAQKGRNTADRPHRMARIEKVVDW